MIPIDLYSVLRALAVSLGAGLFVAAVGYFAMRHRYDWQRWTASAKLPSDGYFEIWVRATDNRGNRQPHVAGNWNPQGYGANAMHRIAVLVG